MHCPVTLVLERVPDSPALEAKVFDAIRQLEQFCDRILGCHVLIRGPQATEKGTYAINLKLRTPEREISIGEIFVPNPEHRDFNAALRDTFALAWQELRKRHLQLCSVCHA